MGLVKSYKKKKKEIVQRLSKHVTIENVKTGLKNLGLKNNDVVFIHSSLSKFGNVKEGPKTILDGLMQYFLPEGTVLFPGFNILGTSKASLLAHSTITNPYNYKTSIPTTGILCRVFKTDYCTDISIHPTHSVLGAGRYAKEITKNHFDSESIFGANSPFAKLLEYDARIVGLGSDFGHVTFVHTLEDLEPKFPIQVYEDNPYVVYLYNYLGDVITKSVKAHRSQKSRIERPSGTYIRRRFWNELKKSNKLKTSKIGGALCWAVGAKDFYQFLLDEMNHGRTIYSEAPNRFLRRTNEILGWIHEINR